jgi:hypothetical protein
MAHTALAVTSLLVGLCALSSCSSEESGGCVIRACYYTADGAPALPGAREAWFYAWEDGPDAGRFFDLSLDGEQLAVLQGPYANECVRFAAYERPKSCDTVTLWAKIQGFAVTNTRVRCGNVANQTVEPVGADTESEQLCERPIVDRTCRITTTVQDQAGATISANALGLRAELDDGGVFEGFWHEASLPGGQLIVDGVQPAVFSAPGYQPRLQCLQCGDNAVSLDRLESTCDRGCSMSGSAPGHGVEVLPLVALVAASGLRWARRRRQVVLER